jgi:hypothetical protein
MAVFRRPKPAIARKPNALSYTASVSLMESSAEKIANA